MPRLESALELVERGLQRGRGVDGDARRSARDSAVPGRRRSSVAPGSSSPARIRRSERGATCAAAAASARVAPHASAPGVSTMTLVALTIATASEPTSRPRSRTASLDISETTRMRPALHVDLRHHAVELIAVTSPTNRFRALVSTSAGSGASPASSLRVRGEHRRRGSADRPASSLAGSRPASTHRRTVSSLTPSSRAASAIRYCVTNPSLSPHLRIESTAIVRGHPPTPHREGASVPAGHGWPLAADTLAPSG